MPRSKSEIVIAVVGAAIFAGIVAATIYGSAVAHARTYTLTDLRSLVVKDPSGWLGACLGKGLGRVVCCSC